MTTPTNNNKEQTTIYIGSNKEIAMNIFEHFKRDLGIFARNLYRVNPSDELGDMRRFVSTLNVTVAAIGGKDAQTQLDFICEQLTLVAKGISMRTALDSMRDEDGFAYAIGDEVEYNSGRRGFEFIGTPAKVIARDGTNYTHSNRYQLRPDDRSKAPLWISEEQLFEDNWNDN